MTSSVEAQSGIFLFDTRDSAGTIEAVSGVFAFEARDLGNVASEASGGFALNTFGTVPTGLAIEGPATVFAGSETSYSVKWQQSGSVLDITADTRWRFIGGAPGNTGMVPPVLYAGQTSVPATVTLVASYLGPAGVSVETPPFTVTILPALGISTTAVRGPTGTVTFAATPRDGSGIVTVRWDLDGDGEFDDHTGDTVEKDYGTWTGSTRVSVEVTDAAGNRKVEKRDVVLNKAPVVNQPVVEKPAYDPGGFKLGVAAGDTPGPFVFNAGGLDRRSSGLVVIVHGLYVDYTKFWIADMARGIESRCDSLGMPPPNIALLDWSELAKDPSELPDWLKNILTKLIEKGINGRNLKALGTGAAGLAINTGFDAYWVRDFGITTGQQLANWIYLNGTLGAQPQIDVEKPIHVIGHSAGGFVAGEAARLLKHPGGAQSSITVDRVTLMDTPFPLVSHLATGGKNYPNPGTVERVISSVLGTFEMPFTRYPEPHDWYRYEAIPSLYGNISAFDMGDGGHGQSHVWYRRTIREPDFSSSGFDLSPIINPATRVNRGVGAQMTLRFRPPSPAIADFVPSGWQTFGDATEDSGTWTFNEQADTGIWTDLTMPLEAGNLTFEFNFSGAGDGDFLAVHFGDLPVLFRGLDLPLSRDGWLPAEIPLDLITASNGKLVFTLVSRGNPNAEVRVRNIRITRSDDPDSDGLTIAQEQALGSDPRNWDSDGDGLTDGDEVNTHFSDPLEDDTDGDGQWDPDELTAGTDPRQSGSVFRVTSVTRQANGSMRLEWPGASGKRYRLKRSQELGTGNYEILADDVPAGLPTTVREDPTPPDGHAFYWIEVGE